MLYIIIFIYCYIFFHIIEGGGGGGNGGDDCGGAGTFPRLPLRVFLPASTSTSRAPCPPLVPWVRIPLLSLLRC